MVIKVQKYRISWPEVRAVLTGVDAQAIRVDKST